MLKVTELNNYLEECKNAIPQFGKHIALADDDEFKDFTRDISKNDDAVVLIGVIPTINGGGTDEDNTKAVNRCTFFAVQKHDSRAGKDEYLASFQTCQTAIKALFQKFLADYMNFDKRCMANDFDFNRWTIEPVRNYHQCNGWVLEIDLTTTM